MLPCTVKFLKTSNTIRNHQQNNAPLIKSSENQSQSCFLSTANYHLTFFYQKSQQPFYEINIRELTSKLNPNSDFITLIQKKTNDPLITIYASTSILEKVQQAVDEYSGDKSTWNILVDTPHHRPKASYFTNISKDSNFRGVITLTLTITFLAIIKNIVNNHMKYGLIPMPKGGPNDLSLAIHALVSLVSTIAFIIGIEKLAFKQIISNRTAAILETLNVTQAYLTPIYVCNKYEVHVLLSMAYVFLTIGMMLKVISYAHLMHQIRNSLPTLLHSKTSEGPLRVKVSNENLAIIQKHANNLSGLVNIKDILYFSLVPTLVYQLWYPRTDRINKQRALRLWIELTFLSLFQQYWMNQHIIPIMKTSTEAFQTGTLAEKAETFLDAINIYLINLVVTAYCNFHVLPNFISELLRFGNRDFYRDWWNSTDLQDFWNRWSLPVHQWCVRHIYGPLQRRGYSKVVAASGVFLFSGAMHEYLNCVPMGFVSYYYILCFGVQPLFIWMNKEFGVRFQRLHFLSVSLGSLSMGFGLAYGVIIYRLKYLEAHKDETNAVL